MSARAAFEPLPEPFLAEEHRSLTRRIETHANVFADTQARHEGGALGEDEAARELVRALAADDVLRDALGADARSLCAARAALARISGFADNQLALQGLGSQPIVLGGSDEQRRHYVDDAFAGRRIAAFALTEAEAGSDVRAMRTAVRADGDSLILDGEKTLITNAGIADFYIVFARCAGSPDQSPRFDAVVVEPSDPGFEVVERLQVMAPHPIGRVRFDGCRVPDSRRVGPAGKGLGLALGTLERFRASVGAAAVGFAARALDEAVAHVQARVQFGRPLAEFQLVQSKLAEMWAELENVRLSVLRAAWSFDQHPLQGSEHRATRQVVSSIAKWSATETAQRIVDGALQLFGGRGVLQGEITERLYREVRALRIYEGTSEIQSLILARELLAHSASNAQRAGEAAGERR